MTKIQLSLTTEEADILSVRAAQLGYNITRFIKYLISNEAAKTIENDNFPTFPMSKRLEQIGLQALKDHKAGKTHEFKSIDELLNP
jgi:uncharacterized protein (DUF1778 family)